ncbi:MAG TPA: TolC family protein [Vicinamibacterales bacterium]|nr:TolC family protein [Vicinamibacterales bacterium]
MPAAVLFLVIVATAAHAQTPPPAAPSSPLTLDQALQYAVDHYPTVTAAMARMNAATAEIDVARAAYLPRLDSVWQSNRATANNVFGQLLPQAVLPSLSGPVLPSSTSQSVWSSAAGALFSWEPFDFGLRHAAIDTAEAGLTRARAADVLTRLDVQVGVADAYLTLVAAQRAVAAAQADLDRRDVLGRAVHALVDNQLRPGAEASRADAEQAAARVRLAQAQQRATIAETTLARVLGITSGSVIVAGDRLIAQLPASDVPGGETAMHPLLLVREASVAQSKAAEAVLARTDYPHVYVQSSVMARGSGANANGTFDGGADGLGLDRANWAAGVQILFPNVFDFASLRARKAAAAAATRAEMASFDEATLAVISQRRTAAALLQSARAIAVSTPIELAAAQQGETQARARYDAGLASIIEVADAQSLLAAAEVQDQLARVDVWRALLAVAAAQGDLTPFANLVRQP